MAIVPTQASLTQIDLAVSLPRYAAIVNYSECAFFGVNHDTSGRFCRNIWTKPERDQVAKYLAEAQDEIEQVVGYPLAPRWIADEQRPYGCPTMLADWGKIIEAGVEATANVSLGALVDHAADPAVVGPVATTVTDEDEIRVYHPGSDVEIIPSAISIAAGFVTIDIPRCRMVTEAEADNAETGLDYTALANFEATVDVKRVYNDPSTHSTLVYPHSCSGSICDCSCDEYTKTGCIYIRNASLGTVDVLPATYSGGEWTATGTSCCSREPELVRLNYRAGLTTLTRQAEDTIVRLAHAKMPKEPCGCDPLKQMWDRDRKVPDLLTRERINCPFGMSDGAWIAWRFSQSMRLVRGGVVA